MTVLTEALCSKQEPCCRRLCRRGEGGVRETWYLRNFDASQWDSIVRSKVLDGPSGFVKACGSREVTTSCFFRVLAGPCLEYRGVLKNVFDELGFKGPSCVKGSKFEVHRQKEVGLDCRC